ncbi:MAG: NinB family protein [Pseudomonas sp.]|nr:NinB family protein [Pseudomonas sp.]
MTEFALRNTQDMNRLIGFLHGSDLTKPKKVVIRDEDRSGEQNKALHAMLGDIARQVEHAGKKWDILIWKRLLTAAWLREAGDQPQMIPAVDGHGFDVIYERTSKLSVKQCASLLEWIQAFGGEHQVRWTAKDVWGGRYDQ